MRRITQILSMACVFAACAGCAGIGAALDYTGTPVMNYTDARDTWRIFDKPMEGKLMITPSLEKSGYQGAVTGATLGLVNGFLPRMVFEETAEQYLAGSG